MTVPDDDIELLGSPIDQRMIGRLFILGGPVGLAIAIMAGLWVAQQHVVDAVIVQVERQWVPSEGLAVRVQVVPEFPMELAPPTVTLAVEQDERQISLQAPRGVDGGAMAQGRILVPSLTPGPATFVVHVEAPPFEAREERLPIEIVASRKTAPGRHVVSTSMSQYADDSDAQPDAVKIDVRPNGRVLAGFDNELLLRVTDASGAPWSGPAAVRIIDGEFASKRGAAEDPPLLWEGTTDAAGLASIEGLLSSEVLRVLVQLRSADGAVEHQRKIRLVSFAGAVALRTEQKFAAPGTEIEILGAGLGARRPVFVDIFGPDGAWIDTIDPPIAGREPPRPWLMPAGLGVDAPTMLQFEGYHFTNAPGESTAVARVSVDGRSASDPATLEPLIARQRKALSQARNDRTWDEKREDAYLDAIARAKLDPATMASVRKWLLGTLPLYVHGPPELLHSRVRDHEALLADKQRWAQLIRWFLLLGGGLFLGAMTFVMARGHARDADATLAELEGIADGEERAELEMHVHQARRSALFQGLLIIVLMAAGIVCTLVTLEVFVWDF